jgi:hypothetical protein
MALFDFLRPRCPGCKARGLRMVGGTLATVQVDGKRAPASWFYEVCPRCRSRWRHELGGARRTPTDEEWQRDVAPADA